MMGRINDDTTRVNRVELIDRRMRSGALIEGVERRAVIGQPDLRVEVHLEDGGQTLRVLVMNGG